MKSFSNLQITFAVLVVLMSGCVSIRRDSALNSDSSVATITVTRDVRVTQSESSMQVDTKLQELLSTSNQVVLDEFSDNRGNWLSGKEESDFKQEVASLGPDTYEIKANAKSAFIERIYPQNYADIDASKGVYAAVDVKMQTDAEEASIGICLYGKLKDSKEVSEYILQIQKGKYKLVSRIRGVGKTLIGLTNSTLIRPDVYNRVAISFDKGVLSVFINDQYVTQIESSDGKDIASLSPGLSLGLSRKGDKGTFEFDNYEVRSLQK